MSMAAVPNYLGTDFSGASPGMRFGMYLTAWEGAGWAKTMNRPLAGATSLGKNDRDTMRALCQRQKLLFGAVPPTEGLCLDAKATAPFTTGLGNEHPLENGFAFFNPYGLPYLPGSGVKGVLRQAARELASGGWGDAHGWSSALLASPGGRGVGGEGLSMLDVLFGRETQSGDSEHVRGVLSFWDVIPQITGSSLAVEIMTPHQGHYYQQGATPHESGQPIPIPFLTVPPGSSFAFHVVCDLPRLRRLAPELAQDDQWKRLLTAAFEHAFAWLGFGAKTAVGYGAMQSPAQRERQNEEGARLKFNRGNRALTAEKRGKSALALKPKGEELLGTLPAEIRNKVLANQFVKVTAYVHEHTLVRIEP